MGSFACDLSAYTAYLFPLLAGFSELYKSGLVRYFRNVSASNKFNLTIAFFQLRCGEYGMRVLLHFIELHYSITEMLNIRVGIIIAAYTLSYRRVRDVL